MTATNKNKTTENPEIDPANDPSVNAETGEQLTAKDTAPAIPASESDLKSTLKEPLLEDVIRSMVETDGPTGKHAHATAGLDLDSVSTFDDEHKHSGGSYTFNSKGDRVPVYEVYKDEKGNDQKRPIR